MGFGSDRLAENRSRRSRLRPLPTRTAGHTPPQLTPSLTPFAQPSLTRESARHSALPVCHRTANRTLGTTTPRDRYATVGAGCRRLIENRDLVKTWTKNTRSTPTFCCTRSFAALTRSLAKSGSKASAFPRKSFALPCSRSLPTVAHENSGQLSARSLTPFARGTIAGGLRHHTATTAPPHRNRTTPSPADSFARFAHSVIHRQSKALTSLHSLLTGRALLAGEARSHGSWDRRSHGAPRSLSRGSRWSRLAALAQTSHDVARR